MLCLLHPKEEHTVVLPIWILVLGGESKNLFHKNQLFLRPPLHHGYSFHSNFPVRHSGSPEWREAVFGSCNRIISYHLSILHKTGHEGQVTGKLSP